jgi:hypothetical protein
VDTHAVRSERKPSAVADRHLPILRDRYRARGDLLGVAWLFRAFEDNRAIGVIIEINVGFGHEWNARPLGCGGHAVAAQQEDQGVRRGRRGTAGAGSLLAILDLHERSKVKRRFERSVMDLIIALRSDGRDYEGNPKSEIRSTKEARNSNSLMFQTPKQVPVSNFSSFEFPSDFEIRISDLTTPGNYIDRVFTSSPRSAAPC